MIREVRNAIRGRKSSIMDANGTLTANLVTGKWKMAYAFRRLSVCEMEQNYLAE